MNEQIKAIRAEIKRLEEIHERNLNKLMERGRIGHAHGYVDCCDEILSFIDTLLEETDNESPNRPKLSDNLGEAAMDYAVDNASYYYEDDDDEIHSNVQDLEPAFIAGAKWQKEQMMKDAVEGEITKDNRGNNVVRTGVFNNGFEIGDKVRIIIVKEVNQ